MNENDSIELVNQHAEDLNRGQALGFEIADPDSETNQLLTVAQRVKSALRPVTPNGTFVRDLKAQLINEARKVEAERQQHWLVLAAGLGGLVYGLGVLAVGYRTSLFIFGLVAVAAGWKKPQAQTTAPAK
jgi:hypothetical protein